LILSVSMPRVGDQMHEGTIHRVVAQPGEALRPGSPVVEVRVDLSAAKAQDCPPIFYFRLIATERAQLRTLRVSKGDVLAVGTILGEASTAPDDAPDGKPIRALRTTSVAIQVDPLAGRE
jgi:hypothetical protein